METFEARVVTVLLNFEKEYQLKSFLDMLLECLAVATLYFIAVSTSQVNDKFVTCGSVVKLKNNEEGEGDMHKTS